MDAGGSALAGSDDFQEPQGSVRAGIKVPRYVQGTITSHALEVFFFSFFLNHSCISYFPFAVTKAA